MLKGYQMYVRTLDKIEKEDRDIWAFRSYSKNDWPYLVTSYRFMINGNDQHFDSHKFAECYDIPTINDSTFDVSYKDLRVVYEKCRRNKMIDTALIHIKTINTDIIFYIKGVEIYRTKSTISSDVDFKIGMNTLKYITVFNINGKAKIVNVALRSNMCVFMCCGIKYGIAMASRMR